MKNIPLSRLILTLILLAITIVDVFVAIHDFARGSVASGVIFLIIGAIIAGRGIYDLFSAIKKSK